MRQEKNIEDELNIRAYIKTGMMEDVVVYCDHATQVWMIACTLVHPHSPGQGIRVVTAANFVKVSLDGLRVVVGWQSSKMINGRIGLAAVTALSCLCRFAGTGIFRSV